MNKCDCVTPDVSKDKCGNVKKNSHAPCTILLLLVRGIHLLKK